MYILFKVADQRVVGPIKTYGHYLDYVVGYIPDTHKDIIKFDHLNATVIDEKVANGWKFADGWRGYISVRNQTNQAEQLDLMNSFDVDIPGEKIKYTLTEEDNDSAVRFFQTLMRKKLDEIYDGRLKALNLSVSELEFSTWAQQREEVKAYRLDNTAPVVYITKLANARGITIEEMVVKIESATQAYDESIATLLANKQAVESEIKACLNIIDCLALLHNRYEITMPLPLQEQLGVTNSATFNL